MIYITYYIAGFVTCLMMVIMIGNRDRGDW